MSNGTEVKEVLQVEPDLVHFSTEIIAEIRNNFQLTTALFEKKNGQLMCILKGPTRNVEEARNIVKSIKINCREVHFSTTIVHVLKTCSIETMINEFLRKDYKFCKSVQVGHDIKVYGFQIPDNTLTKAVMFVSKLILEKEIVLTGDYLRSHANAVVNYIKETYKNSILVTLDQRFHLHLVGVNNAILEIDDFIVKVKSGEVSLESVGGDPQAEENPQNRKECISASKWPGRAIRETLKDDGKTMQTVKENAQAHSNLTDDKETCHGRNNTTQDAAEISEGMPPELIVSLPPEKDTTLQVQESENFDHDQWTKTENEMKGNTSHWTYENEAITKEKVVKPEDTIPPSWTRKNYPHIAQPIKNLSLQQPYEETYSIDNEYQQNFIETNDVMTKIAAQFMIDFDFDKYRHLIKLRGPEENVRKARGHLETFLKELVCKHLDISQGKSVKYFMSNDGRNYLENTGKMNDVWIEMNTTIAWNFCRGQVNELQEKYKFQWSCLTKSLILIRCDVLEATAAVKFKLVKTEADKSRRFRKEGNQWNIGIDSFCEDKTKFGDTRNIFFRALTKITESEQSSSAFHLTAVAGWNFDEIIRCSADVFVKWLITNSQDNHTKVILCVFEEDEFFRTNELLNEALEKRMESILRVDNLSITVKKGQIDQTEADVVVNTTDCQINLQNGQVSLAISRAAGSCLQDECNRFYPNGVKHGEVAVTKGYKLRCKHIFHISLPAYKKENETQCFQLFKDVMQRCLNYASDEGHTTIAFPAIGTGNLGYPKDSTTSLMFLGVDKFKSESLDTSLEQVYFVIYPKDRELLEKFESTQREMASTTKPRSSFGRQYKMTITITGSQQNVEKALVSLEQHLAVKEKELATGEGNNNKDRKNTARSKPLTKIQDTTGECPDKVLPVCSESGRILTCLFDPMYRIDIYSGDVLNLAGIECLVCQAGEHGEPVGNIAKTIQRTCSCSYMKEKAERFKSVQICDAVTTHSGHSRFKFIIHTVVSKHSKNVGLMYKNILTVLRDEGIASAVLPLLGTDESEEYGPDAVTKILFKECLEYCKFTRRNKLTLHLVVADENLAKQVQRVFKRCTEDVSECLHLSQIRQEGTDKRDEELNTDNGANTKHETSTKETEKEETCVICMDDLTDAKRLRCGHTFCKECIDGYFKVKQVCPTCGTVCGIIVGNQPDGIMEVKKVPTRLTGFERFTAIAITYQFHDGQQWPEHPRPGTPYTGITRTAYLPDNTEGQEICALLTVAFSRRLVFTIGTSRTTGKEGVITWNDIHHKTDPRPNTQFGYPDATYLQRVREEIKVKGVKLEDVSKDLLTDLTKANFKHVFRTDTRL